MRVWRRNIVWSRALGLFVLTLCLCLASCRPSGVLSSRQMRQVLHDLHRADAIMQVAGYNYGHDEALAKYYQAVLDSHGITQAQFDSSMVWYTDHPQIFDKIYPRVVADLEREQQEFLALNEETENKSAVEPRKLPDMDSIRTIYQHGYPDLWLEYEKNAEKCKKSDEKFAYVVEIS